MLTIDAKWVLPEPAPSSFLQRQSYYPWLVLATTCIASFIGQVDASIVQLALPQLERVFDAPLHSVSWVAVAYVLAFASALPVFARLAELAGRKSMYLVGFALFGLASALCGLAPSLPWLIASRVMQGIGGAMLGANSIVLLVTAVGPSRKGRAMGFLATAQAIGVSAGPVLGGLILSTLSWHWVFWVSVPFALAGVAIGWIVLPRSATISIDRRFDGSGAAMLVPALTGILLMLTHVHAWGVLSVPTLACAIASLLLLAAFVRHEQRVPAPLLDIALFRSRAFSGGCTAVLLSYAMIYVMFFVMSFALVRGYHDAPLAAGLRLAIVAIALGIVAPLSGGLSATYPRLLPIAGMTICGVSALVLSRVLTGSPDDFFPMMVALAAYGAGLGIFIAPNNTATINAAPPESSGQAGGLLNLLRVFGVGFGVAAASSVLSWRLAQSGAAGHRTIGVPESALLAAVSDALLMVALFAVVACVASLLRARGADSVGA